MWWFALFLMALGAACIVWSRAHWTAVALFVFATVFVLKPAFGHDHNRPELNEWMKSLHSKGGAWCCDGNDTDKIDDWDTQGGKYRVKFRGTWYDVPDEALVEGPNKSGAPMLWMNKGWGEMKPRCFMPGTLS